MKIADKYSPQNLGEVVYPNEAVKVRIQAYMSSQLEGHLLLWGPNGTGKTTVANLLPQYISGPNAQIDTDYAALLQKLDLQGYIANSCHIASMCGQPKYFMVFHEFDNAANDVHELWTALDKYSDRLMLIITTNNPMNVHRSVRSRCDEIHFPALAARQILPRAQKILAAEGVSLPDQQVLHYLTQIEHHGDLRKYLAKLDEIVLLSKTAGTLPPVPTLANKPRIKFSVV